MVRLLLGAFLLLTIMRTVDVQAADSNCEPRLYAAVNLKIEPNGKVYVPATIGGHEVYFLFSLGSGLPGIVEGAIESLELKARPRVNGADMRVNGKRITHYVMLENLKLGDFRFAPRAAPVLPEIPVRMLDGRPVVGVIGATLIQNVDAELYLAQRQLKLFQPFRCRSRSPVYWGSEAAELPMRFDPAGALVFTLELEGRKVEASLLAGDPVSTIDVNVTREFFGFDEHSPGVEVETQQGGRSTSLFHAMSVTGHALAIKDARVRLLLDSGCKLAGSPTFYYVIGYSDCSNRVPFVLGIDLLAQLRIYFSNVRQKMFVSYVALQPGNGGTVTISPTPVAERE